MVSSLGHANVEYFTCYTTIIALHMNMCIILYVIALRATGLRSCISGHVDRPVPTSVTRAQHVLYQHDA